MCFSPALSNSMPNLRQFFAPPFFRLWGIPIVLAALIASGLFSALVLDGWGDVWAWFALGVPVIVMYWFGKHGKRGSH